jgi:DNA repair photolyase
LFSDDGVTVPTSSRQLALPFVRTSSAPGKPGGQEIGGPGGVELVEMTCRSVLNLVQNGRIADFYSVNPYRGCEHACAYCYARYTHGFLDQPDAASFERRVYVKVNAPEAFARDLRHCRVLEHRVSFGSATDPYQPAEARFQLTRRMLEKLLPLRGLDVSIITKSPLVERDAELLAGIAARHRVSVIFSCLTLDPTLQRALEPGAAEPERRLEAIARLSAAGVETGLALAPLMPGINDSPQALELLCRRARQAGASFAFGQPLFMLRATRGPFFAWLTAHRPDLLEPYRRAFVSLAGRSELPEPRRIELKERLARALASSGLGSGH